MPPTSFYTFENIRKPEIFWFFQGVWTENNDMKWLTLKYVKLQIMILKSLVTMATSN